MSESNQSFPELLAGHQQRLLSYIVSLIGDADSSWDVLQETNRVLLEKRGDFQAGTNFVNWALTDATWEAGLTYAVADIEVSSFDDWVTVITRYSRERSLRTTPHHGRSVLLGLQIVEIRN